MNKFEKKAMAKRAYRALVKLAENNGAFLRGLKGQSPTPPQMYSSYLSGKVGSNQPLSQPETKPAGIWNKAKGAYNSAKESTRKFLNKNLGVPYYGLETSNRFWDLQQQAEDAASKAYWPDDSSVGPRATDPLNARYRYIENLNPVRVDDASYDSPYKNRIMTPQEIQDQIKFYYPGMIGGLTQDGVPDSIDLNDVE